MAVFLLDTTVIIDALNGKKNRPWILNALLEGRNLLACCPINVTEVYAGMRPRETGRTELFLQSLRFHSVTWEVARVAGELQSEWRKKGHTLALPDATIAAVALTYNLTLLTDNRKDFPMPELNFYPLP